MAAEEKRAEEAVALERHEVEAGERGEWAWQPAREHFWTQSGHQKPNRQEHYYR
jgi:hypothetical protein